MTSTTYITGVPPLAVLGNVPLSSTAEAKMILINEGSLLVHGLLIKNWAFYNIVCLIFAYQTRWLWPCDLCCYGGLSCSSIGEVMGLQAILASFCINSAK